MNKRRRFGAKRRRREAKLKHLWLTGMSAAALFGRMNSGTRPSILDRFRPGGLATADFIRRHGLTVTGRFPTAPELQNIPAPGRAYRPSTRPYTSAFGRKA